MIDIKPRGTPHRSLPNNLLRGVGHGLARAGYGTADAIASVVDACSPGEPMHGVRKMIHDGQAEADAYYAPEGLSGDIASGVAQFAGDAAIGAGALKVLRAVRGAMQAQRAASLLRPPVTPANPSLAASPLEYLRPRLSGPVSR